MFKALALLPIHCQYKKIVVDRMSNASSSRNLLSTVLQLQLINRVTLCTCKELVWLVSGFKASGANIVISSSSDKRLRLMEWISNMSWPFAWLLWPDQETSEQRSELKGSGFSSAQVLAQMSIHSKLVPPRIKFQESLVYRSIRIARFADLNDLVRHYELVHNIPRDYAFQVATAHLVTCPKNVCCTWVAVNQSEILASITAYKFGRQGFISWLATCPTARKNGIGSRLLFQALNHLKDREVSGIELQSVPEAVPFYQKIGFTKDYDVELWIYPGVT